MSDPRLRSVFVLMMTFGQLTFASTNGGLASDHGLQPGEAINFSAGYENQAGLTFSPDKKTAWWTEWNGVWGKPPTSPRQIYTAVRTANGWSPPALAPFSSEHGDDDPFVSPDGRWLYFTSERPSPAAVDGGQSDIWRFELHHHTVEYVDVNSSANEYSPVVAADGSLYFASDREDGVGQGDIYYSAQRNGRQLPPRALGHAINSVHGEWNVWIAPDQQEMVFEASSRPTNLSIPGDLYYSWQSATGWVPAVPLSDLNSTGSDLLARAGPAGQQFVFTRAPLGGNASLTSVRWPPARDRARRIHQVPLWVANRSSHELVRLNLATGEIASRLDIGAGPHLLSNLSNGQFVATGYGVFPKPHQQPVSKRPPFVERLNSRLTVVDATGNHITQELVLEDCLRPHASWLRGDRAYVTCEDEKAVHEINLLSGERQRILPTSATGSHTLAFEPQSGMLGVGNTGDGSIVLIELASEKTTTVNLASGSEGMLAFDGQFWVANSIDRSISVVDPASSQEVRRIRDVCAFPIALSPQGEDRLWVACFGSREVVAVSTETAAVERRFQLADAPLHIAVHPCIAVAYVSLPRQNAVAEIDLHSGQETRRFTVGIEPDGLRFGPASCLSASVVQ